MYIFIIISIYVHIYAHKIVIVSLNWIVGVGGRMFVCFCFSWVLERYQGQ